MDELQVGDRVLTVRPSGSTAYEDVYIFGHKVPSRRIPFLRIHTSSNATVHMTGSHYVHVARSTACRASPRVACAVTLPARELHPGDLIFVAHPTSGQSANGVHAEAAYTTSATPAKVVSITWTMLEGMYAPFTMGGSIVVDGVLAHSMAEAYMGPWFHNGPLKHLMSAFYHASMGPVRLLYRLFPRQVRLADCLVHGNPGAYPEGWAGMSWRQTFRVALDAFLLAPEEYGECSGQQRQPSQPTAGGLTAPTTAHAAVNSALLPDAGMCSMQ